MTFPIEHLMFSVGHFFVSRAPPSQERMVGAGSLPAWAVLAIEAARLAAENGWLGGPPRYSNRTGVELVCPAHAECQSCSACAECPGCSPVLRCPEAVWWPTAGPLVAAAVVGASAACLSPYGGRAARTAAPPRRGGGVVA